MVIAEQIILTEYQEEGWLTQFLVTLFFLFFLPGVLTLIYLILTAPWFDKWLYPYVGNVTGYYILKGGLFLAISYIITRIYIISVFDAIRTQETIVETFD